jgi:hypothetical protein
MNGNHGQKKSGSGDIKQFKSIFFSLGKINADAMAG